jgi:hypothetical protein
MANDEIAVDAIKTAHNWYIETTRWIYAGVGAGILSAYGLLIGGLQESVTRIAVAVAVIMLILSSILATLSIFKRADFWRRWGDHLLANSSAAVGPIPPDAEGARKGSAGMFSLAGWALVLGGAALAFAAIWNYWHGPNLVGAQSNLLNVYEDESNLLLVDSPNKRIYYVSKTTPNFTIRQVNP